MEQGPINLAIGYFPQQPSRKFGRIVLQSALHLQKLNVCSMNNLKKHLAGQHQIDCNTLDAALKPLLKKAMDRNILKSLGHTAKISETKRRRKSSSGGSKRKRRKSSGSKRRKSTRRGGSRKSGGKRRRRRHCKTCT
ncbi:h15 domain-containing protein [Nephila pilipes]|uniref:H15 domain-containing protein n=1 Tax=Nephila pilipes TaxID=299642 RepID=A0A8X6PPJ5_NEPPI|nr:h15 domain-containing protein [Nephila pilipes]